MKFAKAHGTGNDFVVLPDPDGALDLTPSLIVALCDRHRGIGGDGVLRVVRSAKHPDAAGVAADAEWFMDYHNADGSVAEMCGNGVRAYVRYLLASRLVAPDTTRLDVATRAGVVPVEIGPDAITVVLPRPVVAGEATVTVGGLAYASVAASVGNPHLVCPVADVAALAALDLGALLVDASMFPDGANVEFIAAGAPIAGADRHVHMRVRERGSGETLSCGSGACAVGAVVLREAGLEAGTVAVDVPGGRLFIALEADTCRLTGPAVVVATGDVDVARLPA
ncbi:MAG TPA: diaminopimelate epimerase [Micromonosporaceae bacterium]|nr:diaminopimelate epimerase [Micromonosporaceae bacterium]